MAGVGIRNSVISPESVMNPILLLLDSVNHSPPAPPAIPIGALAAVGIGNSVMFPSGVMRPILFPAVSVNHRVPSSRATMSDGALCDVGTRNSVMMPAGVMRPILLPADSVNHRAPSGAAAIPFGALAGVGTANSVMLQSVGGGVSGSHGLPCKPRFSALGRTAYAQAFVAHPSHVPAHVPSHWHRTARRHPSMAPSRHTGVGALSPQPGV